MKKSWIILAALGLCACASVNKNTVSYQMSKYDQQVYYVIAGEGDTKSAAAADARMNMRKNIELNVVDAKEIAQVEDLLANAKIVKTWRDKSQSQNKHYLSLAVLKRATAQKILEAPINDTDAQLGALATQLQATEDKFAGLRAAFAMDPLIAKRNILEDLYVFVSEEHKGYETERFNLYKKAYNDRLANVKVSVSVQGQDNKELLSRITDAINQLGLSVVLDNDPAAQLAVEVEAEVDGYQSDKVKGLEWADTSAAVSLRDVQNGGTFARFNVHDRAGTSRPANSVRKSMESIGDKAATEIVQRLTNYLKTK